MNLSSHKGKIGSSVHPPAVRLSSLSKSGWAGRFISRLYAVRDTLYASRRGQTLIEALAAIAVTMLVVTSLVSLGVGAIRSATVSRNRSLAVSYAQEGMEAIRSIRDRSFSEFENQCSGTHGLDWSGTQWGCNGAEILGIFTRSFTATEDPPADPNCNEGCYWIQVTVTWTDRGEDHTVSLDSYLTNWR